jgi:hypothetical protein
VGHGTVTAGIAAGNGSAFASGEYRGIAPDADLVIVKLTSDGGPSYTINGTIYPGETAFTACHTQALDWLNTKIGLLGKPVAALINSGVQLWGPIDGTSILSESRNTNPSTGHEGVESIGTYLAPRNASNSMTFVPANATAKPDRPPQRTSRTLSVRL